MRSGFGALVLVALAANVAAQPQSSPLTQEQRDQIAKMPAMSDDKRVKAEDIDSVMAKADTVVLDVRDPKEIEELGGYEGAINIPVTELEKRLGELSKDKTYLTA